MQHLRFVLALSFAALQLHCGDDSEPLCTPGAQVECACQTGDPGIQVCEPDGESLGPCDCGVGGSGPGGGGSDVGGGASGPGGGGSGPGGSGPGGGGDGGGGNGPCAPAAQEPCYEGPANTEDVGICEPGTRICDVMDQWGECMGQVLPLSEDCQTEADEDCNGATPSCGAGFALSLGETTSVLALTFDADGNIFAMGQFDGTVDFGGGNTLTDVGTADTFIVKFNPAGEHLWSHAIGDPINSVYPSHTGGLAVDSTGSVYLALGFNGDVTVFGQDLDHEGNNDGVLVKLDASGAVERVTAYGSVQYEYVQSLTVDADDNLIMTVPHNAPLYFGGADVLNAGRALVKLDPDGNHIFSRTTVDATGSYARLVTDPVTGNILLATRYFSTADLGLGPITPMTDGPLFFGTFDGDDGSAIAYGASGGTSGADLHALAVAPNGDLIIGGTGDGVLDFGQPNPIYVQAYVARLTPDLQPVFVNTFIASGQSAYARVLAVGVDNVGNALAFGTVGASFPPGTVTVGSTMITDNEYFFTLDAQGNFTNVDVVEDANSYPYLYGLQRAPDGVMVAFGFYQGGPFSLGGQTVPAAAPNGEGLIVRMAPN